MKIKLLTTATLAAAGVVLTGAVAVPTVALGDNAVKRDEDTPDVVLVEEEDDDDTATTGAGGATTTAGETGTNDDTRTNTGNTDTGTETSSGDQNDPTNSRVTAVSRDKDLSQGDLTRDWTQDGPGPMTLDTSQSTNDASKNDTRG